MTSAAGEEREEQEAVGDEVDLRAHALAPDLDVIRRYMLDMIRRGKVVELVAALIGLLQRMMQVNTELTARIASASRKQPPNESLRRLQLELPLLFASAANDVEGPPEPPPDELEGPPEPTLIASPPELEGPPEPRRRKRKKRGAKKPHRHGRSKLPPGLRREDKVVCVGVTCCPKCGGRLKQLEPKTAEKLERVVEQYYVLRILRETLACIDCREYIETAGKPDEVLDRGILGNDLLVESLVDHYDDSVPWERMERNATERGVPLKANTLAASVGSGDRPLRPRRRPHQGGDVLVGLHGARRDADAGARPRAPAWDPVRGALARRGRSSVCLLRLRVVGAREASRGTAEGPQARQRDVRRLADEQLRRARRRPARRL